MSSDERELGTLVDRDLPWPTQMEFVAARDRVLDQLRAAPQHRVAPASRDAAPHRFSRRPFALAVTVALVIAAVLIVWPRGGVRIYAAGNDGLQVPLADASRVEMRAHSEMTVGRASDGIHIDLKTGDIIVSADSQRDGNVYVRTKDMTIDLSAGVRTAKADGTVFLVNADQDGSRVGVIDGEVRVREGNKETRLRPGEQVATSPAIVARPLTEGITWSRNASAHLAVLDRFMKAMTETSGAFAPVATPRQGAPVVGQSARPEFDVASIRACDPDHLPAAVPGTRGGGGSNSLYMTPGRFHALCMTPATLIRSAYGYMSVNQEVEIGRFFNPDAPERMLPTDTGLGTVYGLPAEDGQRVRGGPGWIRTEKYTIEAIANSTDSASMTLLPGTARFNQPAAARANAALMSGPMLLALLEQRFKLKAHIETGQVPALALVVAPGGLKIKPAAPDSCTPVNRLGGSAVRYTISERQGLLPNFPERPPLLDVRRGQKPVCGQILERDGPNRVIVAGGSTFDALALVLGRFVGPVRVYDKTGVTNTFDWILEFAPEEDRGLSSEDRGLSSASDPTNVSLGQTIFSALQQQLGLRLEPAQAPRGFIVIDAIERPTPN